MSQINTPIAANVSGIVPVANGGTGASTAVGAAAALQIPYIVANSNTAASVTGTTSETTLGTFVIPANAMGANGTLIIIPLWSYTNSGNNKSLICRFGATNGTQYLGTTVTTSAVAQSAVIIRNNNSTSAQKGNASFNGWGTTGSVLATSAVDTTAAVTVYLRATCANAADTITLEGFTALLVFGV